MNEYIFFGKIETYEYFFEKSNCFPKDRYFTRLIKERILSVDYEIIATRQFLNLAKEDLVEDNVIFLKEINRDTRIENVIKDIDGGVRIYTDFTNRIFKHESLKKSVIDLENAIVDMQKKYEKQLQNYINKIRDKEQEIYDLEWRLEEKDSYEKLNFFNLYKKLK